MTDVIPALLAATEHASGEHTNPLVPEANELIWGTVAFVLLFIVLSKFVFPKLNKALADRTANIEGKLDLAEKQRQEADALVRSYQQKIDEANAEAARIIENARGNADRLEAELRAKAEEQARRIVERANESIETERQRAMQSLQAEVGGMVVDLTTRIVGESLDGDRQLRLVDQYITELQGKRGA